MNKHIDVSLDIIVSGASCTCRYIKLAVLKYSNVRHWVFFFQKTYLITSSPC